MIERAILQALQQATTAAVAASTSPTLPVAYVDVNFTTPNDQKYLEILHIPNNPASGYWNGAKDYQGLYRMILHWPINGGGAYAPMDLLASIASYFTKGGYYSGVKITSEPDLTGVISKPPELLFPCTLQYSRFDAS